MRTALKGHSMKAEPLLQRERSNLLPQVVCSLSSIQHTHKLSITFFFFKEKTDAFLPGNLVPICGRHISSHIFNRTKKENRP